jgi:ceramide glucosyltransferase
MLMQARALESAGGLHGVRDVLAEDFVLGRRFAAAGHRVVVSRHVMRTVNVDWAPTQFFARHLRWSQLRRHLGAWTYLGEPLLNPTPGLLAVIVAGGSGASLAGISGSTLAAGAAIALALKVAADVQLARRLGCTTAPLTSALLVPVKDVAVAALWLLALFRRTVVWRGHRLRIGPGSVVTELADTSSTGAVDAPVGVGG